VDTIRSIVGGDNYYLIGIDQSDGEDPSLIFHEVAHGLWFSSSVYKRKQFNNIERMNQNVRDMVAKKITGMGYGENVVDDEIQAYLSTGVGDNMTRIKDIKQAQLPFKAVFDSYAGKIKPKKISIDWSTDLDK
jgi:DNA polymerase/3'-5' exonuclease PolX